MDVHPHGKHTWSRLVLVVCAVMAVSGLTSRPAHAAGPETPYDFDASGSSDLVAGTPGAGSAAGSTTVLPGSAVGPTAAGRLTITQDTGSVPGGAEAGDRFGASTASGDLDGDGRLDLVVGAPGENDTSGNADRGSVTVLTGASGLTSGASFTTGAHWGPSASARLGTDVEVGDVDGDGLDDAIGLGPGTADSGSWLVWRDSATGAVDTRGVGFDAAVAIDGAVGDFNGDGYDDLAVTTVDTHGIGKVFEFTGGPEGLTGGFGAQVPAGRTVDAGDIDKDGYDDLVVGQPVAADSDGRAGGQIALKRGHPWGLNHPGDTVIIHQDTDGIPGAAEAGDAMGSSVALRDVDSNGVLDVLTGLPGEDLTVEGAAHADAGSALVVRLTTTLTVASAQVLNQGTGQIPGAAETGDRFGADVAAGDFTGTSTVDLAIGAPGENSGDGTIVHLTADGTASFIGPSLAGTPADAGLGTVLAP
ncbi:FG-GAP-like repeat-containing protein [Streptomyces sp. AS02]|uniref:FG-GAP-like repeat-containing protein n=1 Tax=Streptomyces sp. AS02 TaxID=2938946 RepID=UPI00201FFF1D|nr:FG-GAP-like repeat-containing protein [Streptomyces sp. AS02]MCL8013395.1 FG-GAP-like repeat-containing protein [Streptomyces sp. AS02]